ncbi:mucin-associated surface protein (MASP), putative [Trypanosoma cruzi marinkellei]|uniref:Mucin-associated surface protein (MASP), putative n=1 Tax=Trypanosoma cruzi marinkellei TaxID=85056 RepID=K2NPH2_TRYCR|nr:mucin-associated surface protein (MASP), putative [Trypanosoma cruzi marinkellei]
MAMMMTGRVLLVCALCVLWCGIAGVADSAADGVGDGSADGYSLSQWRILWRRCAEEVSRKTKGGWNTFAVEECVHHGIDGVRAIVDGPSRWRRQHFAVAAADDDSTGDVRNSAYSPEDQQLTGVGLPGGLQVKSPVATEPRLADTTTGENLPKLAESTDMPKVEKEGASKEKNKEEKPTVVKQDNESTIDGDKQVGTTAVENQKEDREKKKGVTVHEQEEIVKPEEHKPNNELEENKLQPGKEERKEDDGETVYSADGQDNKEGEGQKEEVAGRNKKGKEVKGAGAIDGTSPGAPAALQPDSLVDVTVPEILEKKSDEDTEGKRGVGRTQAQEAAGSSPSQNLSAELGAGGEAAQTAKETQGKKTPPADAGNGKKTVGETPRQETPAAEKETHNKEKVPREEEDAGKSATSENSEEKQISGNDNAHNEAENTGQENENEVKKTQETKAVSEETEEPTGKKSFTPKRT